MENLKVENVIISKQIENSKNYQRFINLVKENNVNVIIVKSGDKVKIDNESYFEILWPDENQISDNVLNNNSIVAKFVYNKFTMLFTGDIEEIAEKKIVEKYSNKLNSQIIKIAHHGSKTSSTQSFIQMVNPKIALIGVGKNNSFGHPNKDVLNRLLCINSKIYRTDEFRRNNYNCKSKWENKNTCIK